MIWVALTCAALATAPVEDAEPEARPWHAGAAVGYLYWQQAYGGHDPGVLLRLVGGRSLSGWLPWGEYLITRAAVEVSWRGDDTRDLSFSHTATTLTLAAGGSYRYLMLRAEALLEIGTTIETTRMRESGVDDRSDVAASLCLGGHGGLGLAYKDVAALMMRGGVRMRARRLDIFVSLGVDWLF